MLITVPTNAKIRKFFFRTKKPQYLSKEKHINLKSNTKMSALTTEKEDYNHNRNAPLTIGTSLANKSKNK